MRLTDQDVSIIKKVLLSYSNSGKVYLHGSRIDDSKKGGDIDLFFVVPDDDYKDIVNNKILMTAELSLELQGQKIDLICLAKSEKNSHSFFNNSQKREL